jgi:hypothetical protein
VEALDRVRVEYFVTGSMASSLQGEPRSTHDIDLVISLEKAAAEDMVVAFSIPGFYLDRESVLQAIETRGMFNLIDENSGDKVDFWILRNDAFDRSRFLRRRAETILGRRIFVSSPEDTILMKLRWAKESGGSEKQFTDVLRVYEVQGENLDRSYLREWGEELTMLGLLQELMAKGQVL